MSESGPGTARRALSLGLFALAVVAIMLLVPAATQRLNLHPILGTVIGQTALLTVTLLFALLDGDGLAGMGLRQRLEGKDFLLMLAVLAVHWLGSVAVALWALQTGQEVGSVDSRALDLISLVADVPPLPFFSVAFLLAMLAGVGEELLFRGYLFTRLERIGLPGWAVIMATAFFFGLLHTSGYGLVASVSKGVMFGVPTATYFWLRRRLVPLMALHFFVDFSAFSLLYLVARLLPQFM